MTFSEQIAAAEPLDLPAPTKEQIQKVIDDLRRLQRLKESGSIMEVWA